ncbi:MAG: VCBS repeat-containing protein [Planctomycetota bacterium]
MPTPRPSSPAGRGLAASVAFLTATAFAQQQLAELRPIETTTRSSAYYYAPAIADLDGDGHDEIIVTSTGSGAFVYPGLGGARFGPPITLAFAQTPRVTRVGDIDGDGDLDLLFSASTGATGVALARNDGSLQFTSSVAGPLPNGFGAADIALGDVDGDGDLDLFGAIPLSFARNALWLNDGTGVFTEVTTTNLPALFVSTWVAEFADTDGDGDLDLVLGSNNGVLLYENDGAGVFTDATATALGGNPGPVRSVAVGDLDGDGDLDLLSTHLGASPFLFRNGGTGVFTNDTVGNVPALANVSQVLLGDLDGDGDRDVLTRVGSSNSQIVLLGNDGSGRLQILPPPQPELRHEASDLAVGDIDDDGHLDLLALRFFRPWGLYLNDRTGALRDVWVGEVPDLPTRLRGAAMADFDRDGDLDVLGVGSPLVYFVNDGFGQMEDLTDTRVVGAGAATWTGLATGDVDGDGDIDAVLAPARLLLNDGTGVLVDASSRLGTIPDARSVELGDVDGDGDLDILIATYVRGTGEDPPAQRRHRPVRCPRRRCRPTRANRSPPASATSTATAISTSSSATFGPTTNSTGQNLVYVNDGTGTFTDETATRLPAANRNTFAVELGDVDGDGDLDIVFGMWINWDGRVELNDGTGVFTEAPAAYLPFANDNHETLHLFDADEDGDLDLVGCSSAFFSSGQIRMYFYRNLGGGSGFANDPLGIDATISASALASGDMDGDGDLDLFTSGISRSDGNGDIRNRMLTNCRRQLEVPDLLQPGRSFRVVHYARKDAALGNHTGVAMVSGARASVPIVLPFGRLFIDPSAMLTLPGVAVPSGPGVGKQTLQLPPNPDLAGFALYFQAVSLADADPFGTLRLTNPVERVIR